MVMAWVSQTETQLWQPLQSPELPTTAWLPSIL
jgi:hypothetical protein